MHVSQPHSFFTVSNPPVIFFSKAALDSYTWPPQEGSTRYPCLTAVPTHCKSQTLAAWSLTSAHPGCLSVPSLDLHLSASNTGDCNEQRLHPVYLPASLFTQFCHWMPFCQIVAFSETAIYLLLLDTDIEDSVRQRKTTPCFPPALYIIHIFS